MFRKTARKDDRSYLEGLQKVSFDFWTTTGPRHIQAGVTIDYGPGVYMLMAQVGAQDDPKGAEVVAGWYRRNVLIYSNLVRLIGSPEERVLLVIGAGHAKLLRDYIRQSPNLQLEETVDFLP